MFIKNNIRILIIGLMLTGIFVNMTASVDADSKEEKHPYICVKGILFDDDLPLALVNQAIVGVGDTISDAKILHINNSSVQYEYKGKIFSQQVGVCQNSGIPLYEENVPRRLNVSIKDLNSIKMLPSLIANTLTGTKTIIIFISLFVYVYMVIALQAIAKRTNRGKGWLAWIPIFNFYLMCRIAGRPGWWWLLFFLPGVNVIIFIIILMEIAVACGKSKGLGLLLLLPPINLIVLGYLAFSKQKIEEQPIQPEIKPKAPYQG